MPPTQPRQAVQIPDPLLPLGIALDQESWNWLSENLHDIAQAVEAAVDAGSTPDQIRYFVSGRTQRPDLARRCEQAARHLCRGRGGA